MTKERRRIKEMNKTLDKVYSDLFTITSHCERTLHNTAKEFSKAVFSPSLLYDLEFSIKVYRMTQSLIGITGRPIEQRPDGPYYTGKDR